MSQSFADPRANRYKNLRDLELNIVASTWYRDSHGLFDYEENMKLTINQFKLNTNCKLEFIIIV